MQSVRIVKSKEQDDLRIGVESIRWDRISDQVVDENGVDSVGGKVIGEQLSFIRYG